LRLLLFSMAEHGLGGGGCDGEGRYLSLGCLHRAMNAIWAGIGRKWVS